MLRDHTSFIVNPLMDSNEIRYWGFTLNVVGQISLRTNKFNLYVLYRNIPWFNETPETTWTVAYI
jgi:hypothetical protein